MTGVRSQAARLQVGPARQGDEQGHARPPRPRAELTVSCRGFGRRRGATLMSSLNSRPNVMMLHQLPDRTHLDAPRVGTSTERPAEYDEVGTLAFWG